MRYYAVADVHGFYSELKTALEEKGFFTDPQPHKLVVCGDLFDRGREALALQRFILGLMDRDEVILIRGNHEDLALQLLYAWHRQSYLQRHHILNGTVDTVCQLTGAGQEELIWNGDRVGKRLLRSPYIQQIIPRMVDYFETDRYIFTHGWIPLAGFKAAEDWRRATDEQWNRARWVNGMEAAHNGATVEGKTIVCGHWHCSFGHAKCEGRGGEFDNDPDFSPYYAKGIIAIDGCTVVSGKVNCIMVEDETA